MFRRAPIAIATLLVIGCGLGWGLGCGGSGSGMTPVPTGRGGGTAATGGTGGGGRGTGGIRLDLDGGLAGSAGGATGTGNTAGANPTGSLVFQGTRPALLDMGPPCTFEEGATGDRWCGFFSASVAMPSNFDLYVVNVTQAAAGVSITCGATDPNCLKLSSTFLTAEPFRPALFQGDTLVYFDTTATPFGWRPGMSAGRALAVADAAAGDLVLCVPDIKGTAVTCLRDLPVSTAQVVQSDLLAGRLDATAEPPLAKIETVISFIAADPVNHFQSGFPIPGGNLIAWSARSAVTGPEVLKVQTMGDDASRVTVASNVNAWRASPDGTRWYWLSQVNETSGVGTLQSAPFPTGTSPTMIAAATVGFELPTPTSVLVVNSSRQLLAFADPVGAPTTSQTLDTGVIGLVNLSPQGHVAYAKAVVMSGQTQFTSLFVKKSDGTGACTLTTATDGTPGDFLFTPSSTGAVWLQRATSTLVPRFTRLTDCMTMEAAPSAVWVEPVGDRGVLYFTDYVSTTRIGTLLVRGLSGGAISGDPATMVSRQVGTFMVLPGATSDVLVYTVDGGGNDDGVYVRPFGP